MTNYKCIRCGYKTTKKDSIVKHINRKNLCHPKKSSLKPKEHIDTILLGEKTYYCEHCDKEFTRTNNMKNHMKICKENSENETNKALTEFVKILNERDKDNKQLIKEQQEMVMELAKKAGIININIDNSKKLIINNFNILPYSETDMSHITDSRKREFYSKIDDDEQIVNSVTNLIKDIHFNPDKPENHNTYITNKREDSIVVYEKDKKERLRWEITEKKKFVQKIIDDGSNFIEKWGEVNENDKYETYNCVRSNGEKIEEDIEKKVGMLIYNEKNMVIDSKNKMAINGDQK